MATIAVCHLLTLFYVMFLIDLQSWYIDLWLELAFHNTAFPVALWPTWKAMKAVQCKIASYPK